MGCYDPPAGHRGIGSRAAISYILAAERTRRRRPPHIVSAIRGGVIRRQRSLGHSGHGSVNLHAVPLNLALRIPILELTLDGI